MLQFRNNPSSTLPALIQDDLKLLTHKPEKHNSSLLLLEKTFNRIGLCYSCMALSGHGSPIRCGDFKKISLV